MRPGSKRAAITPHDYPSDLAALTPAYLAKLPADVIDGTPLHYQRTADGRYKLYSIGWNGRDDGGQLAWTDRGRHLDDKAGDWVWQYQPSQPPEFRHN